MFFPIVILAIMDDSDREFMKVLYIEYQLTMFRMARALTDSSHDAEDVVSDACVSLIKKISVLRRLDCNVLEGYIISTTKNAAYMLHRKRNARREVSDEKALLFAKSETFAPDERVLQESTIEELMCALDQLSEGDQAVIRMKYFEKLPDHEIAKALGIQEVSVRSKLTRARKRIFELLGGYRGEKRQ